MDAVTLYLSSLNNPILTEASTLLNSSISFIIVIALLLLFFEPRWEKRAKLAVVMAVALILSAGIKEVVKEPRPCLTYPSKVPCPVDYSFPSNHAIVAFALMFGFINKPSFPVYFLFALFVAFSRVYLGVHTFEDVLAGLVLAPIAYQTVELIWKHKPKSIKVI
jgi:undecaprenyl-diphosphatase